MRSLSYPFVSSFSKVNTQVHCYRNHGEKIKTIQLKGKKKEGVCLEFIKRANSSRHFGINDCLLSALISVLDVALLSRPVRNRPVCSNVHAAQPHLHSGAAAPYNSVNSRFIHKNPWQTLADRWNMAKTSGGPHWPCKYATNEILWYHFHLQRSPGKKLRTSSTSSRQWLQRVRDQIIHGWELIMAMVYSPQHRC